MEEINQIKTSSKITPFLNLISGLLPFSKVRIFFLRLFGNKISYKAKLGWGFYFVNEINLAQESRIGIFNFFRINKIELAQGSFIKQMNYFKGPFNVFLGAQSGIGRQNKFRRSAHPISYGLSQLKLGFHTFLTSNNFFDLTRSITFGDNTQLGGVETQFWTHGYMHANTGKDRIRIDGKIDIKNNVYIGSRCLFNPGVTVHNSINIGGNSVISKDLIESGMYVNQPLRILENDIDKVKKKLKRLNNESVLENVYLKE